MNAQASRLLILGVASIVFAPFNFGPGLLSALGCVGALTALFAFLAGAKGLRAAREPDDQGRELAIAGNSARALGLLLFIIIVVPTIAALLWVQSM